MNLLGKGTMMTNFTGTADIEKYSAAPGQGSRDIGTHS